MKVSKQLANSITKPSNSAFKQQRLKACQLVLTPIPVILTFLIIGFIFVPLGVVFFITSNNVRQFELRYDHICPEYGQCTLNIGNLNLRKPVYFYYRLVNFYQNHRRYVKSRSDTQLRGVPVNKLVDISQCDPFASFNGSSDPAQFYYPCGLISHYVFNDTFLLRNESAALIPLRKQGIAWSDLTDEDFIVWMRTAGLPDFRKLYRIIDEDLVGNYSVQIFNNFPVSSFSGQKHIVISEVSWLGGKNPFLGISYMAVGSLCLVLGIAFLIKHLVSGRPLGDVSYLEWNKN